MVQKTHPVNTLKQLRGLLPSTADYQGARQSWRGDLMAGITVGIVALPLALAFGVSSGAGAQAGLITAVVAGLVAALFGGSHVQVSGPTGAMVVVLGPIVAVHGVQVVAAISVMAGVLVICAGVLRLGRTVAYIPWPVIEGFTLGIAVIIFLQQVPSAFGVAAGHSTNAAIAAVQGLASVDRPTAAATLAVVLLAVLIMIATPRIYAKLPGSIVAIVAATALAELLHLPVARIGELPSALPAPALPGLSWDTLALLAGPAVTIAALAAIESLLSARVASAMTEAGAYDGDRELVGQGLASVAAGFFGGMPATGAIARTAVNVRSGGRTRISAMTHSLVLLGVVYLATGPVSRVPLAALAGILMFTAVRMVSAATVRSILRSTRADAAVFVVTALVTVSFDLIVAVEIGILAAAFFALRTLAKSSGVHREELPGEPAPGDSGIALFRIDGALFFGTAERVLERVNGIRDVHVVILRLSQLEALDATGANVLSDMVRTLERRGVSVLVKGIQPRHLSLMTTMGVLRALSHGHHLFEDLDEAVAYARQQVASQHSTLPGTSREPRAGQIGA